MIGRTTVPGEAAGLAGQERTGHIAAIARGSGIVMLGLVAGAILQYAYNLGLARMYGAAATGQFVFALSLISIAAIVGQLGAGDLALRYVASYRGQGDRARLRGVLLTALAQGLCGAATFGLLLWLGADRIAAAAGKPQVAPLLRNLLPLVPLLTLIAILAAAFQGAQRLERTVLLREIGRPLAIVLSLLIAWSLAASFSQFLYLNVAMLALVVFGGALLFWHEFADARRVPAAHFKGREWLRFSLPVMLMDVFRAGAGWLDTLILGFFVAAEDVAIYFAALRTALLLTIVLAAFNAILAPLAADLWARRDLEQLGQVFRTTTRWTVALVLPSTVAVILVRAELMALFGDAYAGAGLVLLLIILGRAVNGMTGGVGRMLVMTGHQRVELFNTAASTVAMLLGMAWAAQRFGLIGVAAVNSAVIASMNLLKLLEVRLLIGIQPYGWSYLKLLAATLLAGLGGWWSYHLLAGMAGEVTLFAVPVVVAAIYGMALLLIGLEAEDRILLRLVRQRLPR